MSHGIHICMGGPDVKMRTLQGTVKFEDHPYFGPVTSKHLSERHPFWALYTEWKANGEAIDANGFATWPTGASPPSGRRER